MTRRTATVLALVSLAALLAGCVGGIGTPVPTPKLSPPVIVRPGVLRAVVDLSYPPFAGQVQGEKAGLDVDVAAAIAEQLGLKLELVDATPTVGADLVKAGTVDIVLGALTVDQAVASQLAFAGTYVSDGPAVFASTGTSVTVDDLASKRIAVQKDSAAYWALADEYGEAPLVVMPSLSEAMKAVASGKADVAAGDALVGSYMLRGFPRLHYVGQIGSAYPLGVGVSGSKPKLESDVRRILDRLASQGVLDTLRRKWAGDLPSLTVAPIPLSSDASAGAGVEASVTP
jgi:polar amino acid transport system substrate-binding protein